MSKKFKQFVLRKLRKLGDELLLIVMVIPLIALIFAGLALPGVIIAFLVSGNNPEALVLGGLLSFIVIGFTWIAIKKAQKLIKEYKNFDDEEC